MQISSDEYVEQAVGVMHLIPSDVHYFKIA